MDPETGNPLHFFICGDFLSNSVGDTPLFCFQGRHSKAERSKQHIQTRMCGVHVVCGDIDELFVYYTDNLMAGGTNTMIQIMRMAIEDLTKKLAERGFHLARSAFIQLDNCPPENKNSTINAFMSMHIDLGYFDVIQLNYLAVGHTHCPIDQKLGAMATIIRQQDFIATPEALIHLLTVENKEKKPGIEGVVCNIALFTLLTIIFCHKGTAFQQYSGRSRSFMMSRRHLTRTRTRRLNILKFRTNCCSSAIDKRGDAT